jgi:hypothetical protein
MLIRRIAISAAFAAGLATLPLSAANAQYYPPCSPFPLFWPFCVAGAVVVAAATIVTAPLRVLAGAPPFLLRAAELLRAKLSPPISRRGHSGRPRLVRELRRLRKPATPARGTRQRRAVLADTGLSSCAHHILSLPVNLDGVLKFAPAFLLLAARGCRHSVPLRPRRLPHTEHTSSPRQFGHSFARCNQSSGCARRGAST